jgi:pyruvate/2-oxoglutarate dehydrogenase complex dihydrolipoamide acyltransferase (E2) component
MKTEPDDLLVEVRVPDSLVDGSEPKIRMGLWLLPVGSHLRTGQRLVELTIGPVSFVIHSPCAGRLVKRLVQEDVVVSNGTLLGVILKDGYDSRPES